MIAAGAIPAADIRVGSQQALAVYAGEDLVWEAVPPGPPHLTFSSPSAFTLATANETKNWDGTLLYSVDAVNWSEWNGATLNAYVDGNNEYKLYILGRNNTVITGSNNYYNKRWVISGSNVHCNGDIRSLLDCNNVGSTTMAGHCFCSLFNGATALVTAPSLPSTTLSESCYQGMFRGAGIVQAPLLPATVMAESCYAYMFYECENFVSVQSSLPALSLASNCYDKMFARCTALTIPPDLPATILAEACYQQMFSGCSALITSPKISATRLAEWCCNYMFADCVNLNSLPLLQAKSIPDYAYRRMFDNCSKIKIASAQAGDYQRAYRIPSSGSGSTSGRFPVSDMFSGTGGSFTGTPNVNTTYYTSNTVI